MSIMVFIVHVWGQSGTRQVGHPASHTLNMAGVLDWFPGASKTRAPGKKQICSLLGSIILSHTGPYRINTHSHCQPPGVFQFSHRNLPLDHDNWPAIPLPWLKNESIQMIFNDGSSKHFRRISNSGSLFGTPLLSHPRCLYRSSNQEWPGAGVELCMVDADDFEILGYSFSWKWREEELKGVGMNYSLFQVHLGFMVLCCVVWGIFIKHIGHKQRTWHLLYVHIHNYIHILDKWENMPVAEDTHAGHTGSIIPDPFLPGVLHEAQSHWRGSVWGT